MILLLFSIFGWRLEFLGARTGRAPPFTVLRMADSPAGEHTRNVLGVGRGIE